MVDTRIKDLPTSGAPSATLWVPTDLSATEKMTIQTLVDTGAPIASQAEAEAGVQATKRMTPLTTAQAIAVLGASAAQGDLADSAVQPGDLAQVATSGDYDDLLNQPSLSADLIYPTEADAVAATIPAAMHALKLNGSVTEGDGLGGLYIDSDNGSADTFTSNGGTRTWYRAPDVSIDRLTSANLIEISAVDPGTAGLAILADAVQADVRDYLDVAPYVADRTALKALDTTKDTVALFDGRTWLWETGDFSTQVTADTEEGVYVEADAIASTSGAWVSVYTDSLNVKWFGAAIDGTTDDAAAINAGLTISALIGVPLYQPAGTSMIGAVITFPDNAKWVGNNYESVIMKLSTYNGAMLKTDNFDSLTGTSDAFAAGVPEKVYIDGIRFEGNYQNTARDAYVQSSGDGLQFFCRKLHLKARVFNMQGIGVWSECPGGNGPTPLQPGYSREGEFDLYIHTTQYEGLVWKGPGDVRVDQVFQTDAGGRITADESDGKVNSPTYGAVNGSMTYGIVIDTIGAEFGLIHSWGNLGGGAIDVRGAPRVNCDHMMGESSHYGGIVLGGTVKGMISQIDIHRTGGFDTDTTEDFIYTTTGNDNNGLVIGALNIYRNNAAHSTARNATRIDGDFLNIGTLKIEMDAFAGHGLVINYDTAQWINIGNIDIARCQGTAPGGGNSAAIHRNGTGTGNSIVIGSGLVRDCNIALKSTGQPRIETINFNFFLNSGQLAFSGDTIANDGQDWNIHGTTNGTYSGSKTEGASSAFDSNSTTEQTLTIAHKCITTPRFGRYSLLSMFDTTTSMSTSTVLQYAFIQSVDATNITAKVKFSTASGTDTAPRYNWKAAV